MKNPPHSAILVLPGGVPCAAEYGNTIQEAKAKALALALNVFTQYIDQPYHLGKNGLPKGSSFVIDELGGEGEVI